MPFVKLKVSSYQGFSSKISFRILGMPGGREGGMETVLCTNKGIKICIFRAHQHVSERCRQAIPWITYSLCMTNTGTLHAPSQDLD